MVATLLELYKYERDNLRAGVIETIMEFAPTLERLPMVTIGSLTHSFNVEKELGSVGFRSVNEAFPSGQGKVSRESQNLSLIGCDIKVDRAIAATDAGAAMSAAEVRRRVKAVSLRWQREYFEGDVSSDPEGFDGVNKRVQGTPQEIDKGGATLTLDAIHEVIDSLDVEPTVLVMNKATRSKIRNLAENKNAVQVSRDELGRTMLSYAGYPIAIVDKDEAGSAMLSDGDIYALSFGLDSHYGAQLGELQVRELGESRTTPQDVIRVEWNAAPVFAAPRAVGRLTNASLT
ncbi:MAG: hypothetical protein RID91_16070 [Azospirillaceae bacterium]